MYFNFDESVSTFVSVLTLIFFICLLFWFFAVELYLSRALFWNFFPILRFQKHFIEQNAVRIFRVCFGWDLCLLSAF